MSEAFLPQLKCAVWDWGDRFMGAKHHLEEVGEYFGKIEGPRTPISPQLPLARCAFAFALVQMAPPC